MLLLIKTHADTLTQQTKTKPQETFEFKTNKQMESFSFNPPLKSLEEGKWLLTLTSFEATKSVFKITNENNSFSSTKPGHCEPESAEKTLDELNKSLELRSLELHVKENRKRGN